MIKITPKAIKDFQTCALLFDYRYNQKLPETILSRNVVTERFENTLKNVINFFLYKRQSGQTPSYAAVLNRWEKLWFPKDTSAQDIINDKHESAYGNMASLTSKAAGVLLAFYNYFSDPELVPIGISEDYNLPIGKVLITDSFDIIYIKNGYTNVVKWVFNYKDSHEHLYNVDFVSMQYAYTKNRDSKNKNVRYGYFDIMSANPKVEYVDFVQEDVDSLNFWVDELSSCSNFVPRRGLTYYCKRCPFDTPCSKWSNWKKDKENKDDKK